MAQVNNIEDPQVMGQDQNETINYDNQEYMEEYQPEVTGDQHSNQGVKQYNDETHPRGASPIHRSSLHHPYLHK